MDGVGQKREEKMWASVLVHGSTSSSELISLCGFKEVA